MKLAASSGVGEIIVVVILDSRAHRSVVGEHNGRGCNLLHEKCIIVEDILGRPETSGPADSFTDASKHCRWEEPPQFEPYRLSKMKRCDRKY